MLEVDGLDAYYGRAQILHGVSLRVGQGEVVALLGRNGAGKSTTLKAIMGLVRPAWGRVLVAGADLTGQEPWRIARAGLGYVPEERRIFAELTVHENLEAGRRPARPGRAPWTAARLFALFPNLERMQHRLGGRMSGGEQQMLAIARTLMGNPTLILLDEPGEGLAPVIVQQMSGALAALKREGAMLIAEQDPTLAGQLADRAVLLETGRVAWEGGFADRPGAVLG